MDLEHTCPECKHTDTYKVSHDEGIKYCTHCGLILQSTIAYVGGNRIDLPYGLNIQL